MEIFFSKTCAPAWRPSKSNLHKVTMIFMLVKETTGVFLKSAMTKITQITQIGGPENQIHVNFSYSFMHVVWQLAKLNDNKKLEKGTNVSRVCLWSCC